MKIKKILAVALLSTTMFGTMMSSANAGELTWIRNYVTHNFPNWTPEVYHYDHETKTVKVEFTDEKGDTVVKHFSCDQVLDGKCFVE